MTTKDIINRKIFPKLQTLFRSITAKKLNQFGEVELKNP